MEVPAGLWGHGVSVMRFGTGKVGWIAQVTRTFFGFSGACET